MKLKQSLHILRARRRVAIWTFTLVIAATVALNLLLPSKWTAESELVLNQQAKDPMTGMPVAAYLVPGFLDTQAEIAASHNVALKVVDNLGLDKFEETKQSYLKDTGGAGNIRDWMADILLKSLLVKPGRESSTLTLSFSAQTPEFASMLANGFAQAYMSTLLDMQTSASMLQSQVFQQQLQTLQANLERAQRRLAQYQRQAGIMVKPDERIDLQSQRLSDLSTQWVGAQTAEFDARAREGGGALAPDVQNNALIQQLKSTVALAEAKFNTAAAKYGANHPYYLQAQAELESDQRQLEQMTAQSVAALHHGATNASARESGLRNALDAEQGSELQHEAQSTEADVLQKEVAEAQRAYSQALAHFSDADLASHVSQADVYALQNAPVPTKANWPRPFFSLFVATIVGTILAVCSALLAEILDRRVRTVQDIESYLDLPVLAFVQPVKLRRRPWLQRPWIKPQLPTFKAGAKSS